MDYLIKASGLVILLFLFYQLFLKNETFFKSIRFYFLIGLIILAYLYRKLNVEPQIFGYDIPLNLDLRFWLGIIVMPFAWLILYYFSGFYKNIFRIITYNSV